MRYEKEAEAAATPSPRFSRISPGLTANATNPPENDLRNWPPGMQFVITTLCKARTEYSPRKREEGNRITNLFNVTVTRVRVHSYTETKRTKYNTKISRATKASTISIIPAALQPSEYVGEQINDLN